jgi:hypothetical protein
MNEQATKKKKITRSYVRGLLEQLKDLGVECVINHGGEIFLTNDEHKASETVMDKAVGILIAEVPK